MFWGRVLTTLIIFQEWLARHRRIHSVYTSVDVAAPRENDPAS